jgi:hypothetical protein
MLPDSSKDDVRRIKWDIMKVMESEYYNILGETGKYWFEEIILKSNY